MLEDAFWEEDIWEYKSKRKPKPVHPNSCSENISESVEKATDGKYQSKGKGNKKRTSENPGETKDHPVCLAETNSQISAGSSQNSSCRDDIQQSQSKETTPKKQCRTNRGKQATPKVRPLYDGHCPSCQMPFSSLLGQTPRWHVFECLDSPPISDTECPDGVLCSSTIPSHYKKYTHVLLAQSRDSKEPLSPSQALAGRFAAAQPDSCNLEERRSVLLKTEDSRKVLEDSLLMIQCLKTSQPPAETNRKSASSPRSQKSLVPQRAEFVKRDQLVGGGSPLAEVAFNCQSESGSTGLPLPENGCGDFEISYSPLHSDEETYNCDQELDDSQQELFFTQSSKDSSLEDVSATFENLHGPFPEEAEGIQPTAKTLAAQAGCSALSRGSTGNDSFQLISRTSGRLSGEDPSDTDAAFLLLSPAPSAVGGATPNCQTTKAKPEKFHSLASRHQQQKTETSAAGSHTSLPLLLSAMSKPVVADPTVPNVTVTRLSLVCDSAPGPITMDLTGDLKALKKDTFVLKEGIEYRVKINFKVNKDIVSGLKYVQQTYRNGMKVDKATFMVGSYGPRPEEYEFLTPVEEAPKGMLARGTYHNKSFFTDDDKQDHLTWEWNLAIKKDWTD